MGCSISCSVFEMFSSFVHWELQRRSNSRGITHYLDDFLLIGRADTTECEILMAKMIELADYLGIPFAPEKTQGPTTCLCFLGLGIDTEARTIFIPEEKVEELLTKISVVVQSKKLLYKSCSH
jgi:hypothetical protein